MSQNPTLSINANTPLLRDKADSFIATIWYRAIAGLLAAQTAPLGGVVQITNAGATSYKWDASVYSVTANCGGTLTVQLPDPSTNNGRVIVVRTIQNFAVVSDSFNVTPLDGSAVRDSILPPVVGKFAQLQSDGTTWQIIMGN